MYFHFFFVFHLLKKHITPLLCSGFARPTKYFLCVCLSSLALISLLLVSEWIPVESFISDNRVYLHSKCIPMNLIYSIFFLDNALHRGLLKFFNGFVFFKLPQLFFVNKNLWYFMRVKFLVVIKLWSKLGIESKLTSAGYKTLLWVKL